MLYAVVPVALVKHYTTNPESRALLRRALKNSPVRNPLRYPGVETDFKRRATFIAAMANYVRKFRRYYRPEQAS